MAGQELSSELDANDLEETSSLDGSTRDPLVHQTLDGRFQVKRLLARGGMGKIYEAIQKPLDRRVALKVMDIGFDPELDPGFKQRFLLEAATAAKLNHPNTVRIYDYGHVPPDLYYIVMEFLTGRTLLQLVNAEAPLDPRRVIHIVRQICGGLAEAHDQGVIHRDLKPSNIFLCRQGDDPEFPKILDFGLVKLTQGNNEEITKSGLFLGSPNYMSPEQIRTNQVDARSDIYSLGVLLYMALTGVSPFRRETQINVLVAQLEQPPPPLEESFPGHGLPESLQSIVMNCLEKKADRRFGSVRELRTALMAVDLELQGLVPTMGPLPVNEGRVVLTAEALVALKSTTWASNSGLGVRPPVSPVTSGASLISERPSARSAVGELSPSPSRMGRRRRRRDPLIVGLLGLLTVSVLALVGVLAWAITRVDAEATSDPPPAEGPATQADAASPELPAGIEVRDEPEAQTGPDEPGEARGADGAGEAPRAGASTAPVRAPGPSTEAAGEPRRAATNAGAKDRTSRSSTRPSRPTEASSRAGSDVLEATSTSAGSGEPSKVETPAAEGPPAAAPDAAEPSPAADPSPSTEPSPPDSDLLDPWAD